MSRFRSISWLCPVLGLLLVVAACQVSRNSASDSPVDQGLVKRVVDGDTLDVTVGSRNERVRLLGIDTPESVKPGTPVQCFAKEATRRLQALLPGDTPVRLVRDIEERDRYGRLLAYVYRQPDQLFVNLDLVRGGYAKVLTYRPNVTHAAKLEQVQGEARRTPRGLWAVCPAASSLPP